MLESQQGSWGQLGSVYSSHSRYGAVVKPQPSGQMSGVLPPSWPPGAAGFLSNSSYNLSLIPRTLNIFLTRLLSA